MKPYYQDDTVIIYHGDCRELMSALNPDAVLTDPPYGIAYSPGAGGRGWKSKGRSWGKTFVGKNIIAGDTEPFDPSPILLLNVPTILWGANHYAHRLPPSPRWLVWDKREGTASKDFADCEMAWTNLAGTARLYHHRWDGMVKASERQQPRLHPAQKPLSVMLWCLGFIPNAQIILDPFMGSGTTLRAAKNRGQKAIGIELEERYCEIAAKRMGQEVLAI